MNKDVKCTGCGRTFNGQRGLSSHQNAPHQTAACRPQKKVSANG